MRTRAVVPRESTAAAWADADPGFPLNLGTANPSVTVTSGDAPAAVNDAAANSSTNPWRPLHGERGGATQLQGSRGGDGDSHSGGRRPPRTVASQSSGPRQPPSNPEHGAKRRTGSPSTVTFVRDAGAELQVTPEAAGGTGSSGEAAPAAVSLFDPPAESPSTSTTGSGKSDNSTTPSRGRDENDGGETGENVPAADAGAAQPPASRAAAQRSGAELRIIGAAFPVVASTLGVPYAPSLPVVDVIVPVSHPHVRLHRVFYDAERRFAFTAGKIRSRPPDLKLGGICGDVNENIIANLIRFLANVNVAAIDLFKPRLGRCAVWVDDPRDVQLVQMALHHKVWMSPVRHRVSIVVREPDSFAYLIAFLQELRQSCPAYLHFPRHTITVEPWRVDPA